MKKTRRKVFAFAFVVVVEASWVSLPSVVVVVFVVEFALVSSVVSSSSQKGN